MNEQKKMIVAEEVVSEPGAGIKITVLRISEPTQVALSTGSAQIPAGSKPSKAG